IEEVGLNFQCEWEAPPDKLCIKVACDGQLIEPGGFVDLTVPIRASLLFQLNTNSFVVHVRYRIDTNHGPGPQRLSRLVDNDYVIVRPVPRYEDALVFVSFKDPEDEGIARLAEVLLSRAGLRAYLAKDDPRPASEYWRGKIEPAIRSSKAILVIWTPRTDVEPNVVLRETKFAQRSGVPVILCLERGVNPPKGFPPERREYVPFDTRA